MNITWIPMNLHESFLHLLQTRRFLRQAPSGQPVWVAQFFKVLFDGPLCHDDALQTRIQTVGGHEAELGQGADSRRLEDLGMGHLWKRANSTQKKTHNLVDLQIFLQFSISILGFPLANQTKWADRPWSRQQESVWHQLEGSLRGGGVWYRRGGWENHFWGAQTLRDLEPKRLRYKKISVFLEIYFKALNSSCFGQCCFCNFLVQLIVNCDFFRKAWYLLLMAVELQVLLKIDFLGRDWNQSINQLWSTAGWVGWILCT